MKSVLAIVVLMAGCAICQQCPEGEVFESCGTACPEKCSNYQLIRSGHIKCIEVCRQGCFCPKGLVRDDVTKKCVATEECPKVDSQCKGEHEVFKTCGTACPKTCDNYDKNIYCIDVCREGCFCENGYVRKSNNQCVATSQCPQRQCNGEHETFQACGTACPKTCDNYDKNIDCIDVCREGCFCDQPYVRDHTGKCVTVKDCPVKPIHN